MSKKKEEISIVDAMLHQVPMEAVVNRQVNGGWIASLGDEEVFVPQSQCDLLEEGDHISGLISEIGTRLPVLSPRKLKRLKALERLRVGKVYDAEVSNVTDFGMFVTLEDGVDGLIPSKALHHWGDSFQPGQTVRVKPVWIDMKTQRVTFNLCGIR